MSTRERQRIVRSTEEYKTRRRVYRKQPEVRQREREKLREWRNTPSGKQKHYGYNVRKKLGITLKQYEEMVVAHGGVCAICGGPPAGRSKIRFCVDHDHVTGHVRGLLCGYCNSGLGHFKDNLASLRKAVEYLMRRKSPSLEAHKIFQMLRGQAI